jgi:hypothetical protein
LVCNYADADVSHEGKGGALEGRGNTAGLQLTVGCEAEHDDAEDELSDAHWEDPVDGHFDGVEILFDRVNVPRCHHFQRCLGLNEGKKKWPKNRNREAMTRSARCMAAQRPMEQRPTVFHVSWSCFPLNVLEALLSF